MIARRRALEAMMLAKRKQAEAGKPDAETPKRQNIVSRRSETRRGDGWCQYVTWYYVTLNDETVFSSKDANEVDLFYAKLKASL